MEELTDYPFFSCKNCQNPVAFRRDLLSKKFLAKSGQAFLFSDVMNIGVGKKSEQQLLSGVFTVADIYCSKCGEVMGWKYLRAYDAMQKFKEGKFIIEKAKILKEY